MHKILVCHTGAWIGDMVLLTPSLRALKQTFPDSCLTFLLRSNVADMMKTNPYVDKCIIDTKTDGRIRSFIRMVMKIRKFQFDLAVILHPTSIRNVLLPFFTGVPNRIGSNYKRRDIFLTKSCQNRADIHEVERYLNVINILTNHNSIFVNDPEKKRCIEPPHIEFWHTDEDRNAILNILKNKGVTDHDRLLAVNLGTTWQTKQWDLNNFSQIINELSDRMPNIKVVLTGSTSEISFVKDIQISEATIDLVGKTNILQLGALLEQCNVCLTCDSGPMHIAAAVGTPTVALFGPTDPNRHKPYGNGHTIIDKPLSCRPCYKRMCHRQDTQFLCMKEITSSEVIEALISKLDL